MMRNKLLNIFMLGLMFTGVLLTVAMIFSIVKYPNLISSLDVSEKTLDTTCNNLSITPLDNDMQNHHKLVIDNYQENCLFDIFWTSKLKKYLVSIDEDSDNDIWSVSFLKKEIPLQWHHRTSEIIRESHIVKFGLNTKPKKNGNEYNIKSVTVWINDEPLNIGIPIKINTGF